MTPQQIEALIVGIFTKLRSHAGTLGVFEHVEGHALINPPQSGKAVSFEFGTLSPYAAGSGLSVTSVELTINASVYQLLQTQPADDIETSIAGAAAALMVSLSGDFDLGSQVRNVQLMGLNGAGGYVKIGGGETTFRTVIVMIPMVINDVFEQVN